MSAERRPDVRYRMPAVFGPAPGPRQKADGTPWSAAETGTMRSEWFAVSYRTEPAALEALLPPGFTLRGEPVVALSMASFHDLYWLAGRGYGIARVEFAVHYKGRSEAIDGTFCPVMWEGVPDAILTGREEMGFPKLFADIPEVEVDTDRGVASGSASWFDHTFLEARAFDLRETPPPDGPVTLPGTDGPTLQFKYVPRVGPDGTVGTDLAYVTTSAPPPGTARAAEPIDLRGVTSRRFTGTGEVTWHAATFEQLPTSFHAVNGMAAIPVLEVTGAELVVFSAPGITVASGGVRAVEPLGDNA